MRHLHLSALAALSLLPGASVAAAQEYYADVRPIIESNCTGCHNDAGVAFSMEDPEESYAKRSKIGRMVESRRMPPWLAEAGHQQYVGDRSLSEAQIRTIRAWAESGFPKGQPVEVSGPTPIYGGFEGDVSLEYLAGGSYLPNQDQLDDYRCFVVDWPGDEPTYITGFRAVPGNQGVAHHVVIYSVVPGMVDRFEELREAEEGMGYQCFGGAIPDRLAQPDQRRAYEATHPDGLTELYRSQWWLAHWAPGMFGQDFPEGTGILMPPKSALVVQMHYYSAHAPGEGDEGGRLEFKVADHVDRPAFHLAQTHNSWLVGERNGSMVIPPGQQATYEMSMGLADLVGYGSALTQIPRDQIEGLEIHSANLHMHSYGHSGEVALTDENGRRETLLRIPRWDLAWQRDFTFVKPKVFRSDELADLRLTVECTFENPTDGPIYGGYGSDDEMCFNFSYIALEDGGGQPTTEGSSSR